VTPEGKCSAAIWHGPGHQSRTPCHKSGEHEVHEAYYAPNGSHDTLARWRGERVFSSYFDEPPDIEEEEAAP
jgi:hypothetical protein